jgi:flavin-dependent dehydrogenase
MPREFCIAGAGPSGLVAAILLARAGHRVTIFEQRAIVGARFNDDYQGLENWTTAFDALAELRDLGVTPTWWHRAFSEGIIIGPTSKPRMSRAERPLFYMVRRGPREGSLDRALLEQAEAAGVEVHFSTRAPVSVDISAAGPHGRAFAVAAGITYPTSQAPMACVILNEQLAPGGYVYYLASDGQATLATVLFHDFQRARACLRDAMTMIDGVLHVGPFDNARFWGGYGAHAPLITTGSGALRVGEGAGFQDFLFGFGIRSALLSGAFAAQHFLGGADYRKLCGARLTQFVSASLVNRVVYEAGGDVAKLLLWRCATGPVSPRTVMRFLYSYSYVHSALRPLAARRFALS